ncbi:MAG: hypothetical protein Q4A00_00300 [Flavobacteriaceae bacterium]|nr:hypothetical protein [Flavobacteriaceae bacterium]
MKKTTILLGVLSLSLSYAQSSPPASPVGKVGVNTETPKETLDVEGTLKVGHLPEEGNTSNNKNKHYNGGANLGQDFQGTKMVVANDQGVLGQLPFTIDKGNATNTSLRWNEASKKWEAVTPQAGNAAAYTGSTSVELSTTGNSFERAALTGDVSAAKNSNTVSVDKIKGKAISATAPTDGQVLTWEETTGGTGEWKPKTIALPTDSNDKSPWFRDNTTPATEADFNSSIFHTGKVGIGHVFSNDILNKSVVSIKGTGSDGDQMLFHTNDNQNYWILGSNNDAFRIKTYGDVSSTAPNAQTAKDTRFNLILKPAGGLYVKGNGQNMSSSGADSGFKYEPSGFIEINKSTSSSAVVLRSALDENNKKRAMHIDFHRGKGDAVNNGRSGYFGFASSSSDNLTIANEIDGADIVLSTNGTTSKTEVTGQLKVNNIPDGARGNKILVEDGNIVKKVTLNTLLPEATNGQVLKKGANDWEVANDENDKSPWFVANTTNPAKDSDNRDNNDSSSKIYYPGNVGLGFKFKDATTANLLNNSRLLIDGTDNHLIFNTSGARWKTAIQEAWYRTNYYEIHPDNRPPTERFRFLLNTNGSLYLKGGNNEMKNTGNNAGFFYDASSSKLAIANHSGGTILELKSHLEDSNKVRAMHIDFYRGKHGDANIFNNRSGYIGFGSNGNNTMEINNQTGGDIKLSTGNNNTTELTGKLKVNTIENGARTNRILVHDRNTVKSIAVTDIIPNGTSNGQTLQWNNNSWTVGAAPQANNEPWFKANNGNTETQATNSDNAETGQMYFQGVVGIGADFKNNNLTSNTTSLVGSTEAEKKKVKLVVKGAVVAGSFKGAHGAEIFPDYVFQKYYTGASSIKADYNFQTLSQVENFVKQNGHLPGYKSAAKIKEQGYVDIMETQLTNVEKIEELYLHSIEQDKALKAKDAEIAELKARLDRLEKLLN